jgi:hypothetical protein
MLSIPNSNSNHYCLLLGPKKKPTFAPHGDNIQDVGHLINVAQCAPNNGLRSGYKVEGNNVIKAGLGHGDKMVNNSQWFTNGVVDHLEIIMWFHNIIGPRILLMPNGVDKLEATI